MPQSQALMKKNNKTTTPETKDVLIKDFCQKLNLSVLYQPQGSTHIHLSTCNISRPGLFLAGFYNHFAQDRVQVIGQQETEYLKTLTKQEREKAREEFFKQEFPCVILSSGLVPDKEALAIAKKHGRLLLGSKARSTILLSDLSLYLNETLAPSTRCHGVLADIYGIGVLIIGKSGVGKSETVLELLQRMHRLVADDAVDIKCVANRLIGSSPESIRHFTEVRGLGLIDISLMYGASAFVDEKQIDLVINLEEWDASKEYDRLGSYTATHKILDVELPMHTIPVKTGRNLAVILEVAARNYRLKAMGHDAFTELKNRLGME